MIDARASSQIRLGFGQALHATRCEFAQTYGAVVKWSAGHVERQCLFGVACAPLDHGTKRRTKTRCVLVGCYSAGLERYPWADRGDGFFADARDAFEVFGGVVWAVGLPVLDDVLGDAWADAWEQAERLGVGVIGVDSISDRHGRRDALTIRRATHGGKTDGREHHDRDQQRRDRTAVVIHHLVIQLGGGSAATAYTGC